MAVFDSIGRQMNYVTTDGSRTPDGRLIYTGPSPNGRIVTRFEVVVDERGLHYRGSEVVMGHPRNSWEAFFPKE
jgi:hypothetical protein